MNELDLSIFVEFGVGLAGFSGVVVAFSSRSGELDEYDRFRVVQLLLSALIPAFFGLAPVILAGFDLGAESVVRIMGAALLIALAVNFTVAVATARGMSPSVRAKLSPGVWRLAIGSSVLFFAWNGLNLAGWPRGVQLGPVVAAMSWFLFMASVMFFR